MNNEEYRAAIDAVKARIASTLPRESIGVIIPACMEIVMTCIVNIEDKEEALRMNDTLRPMIDYHEQVIRGTH